MFRSCVQSFATLVSLLFLSGCGGGSTPTGPAPSGTTSPAPAQAVGSAPAKKRIAVIPKNTAHEFWKQIGEGAQEAVKGHDVEIIFNAGNPADQAEAQLALVEHMLAQKIDAIVLAPVHPKFLIKAVDECFDAKIPLVIIDSAVDSEYSRYTAYVATDHRDGGAQCARTLANALGKKGAVLLFRYQAGNPGTTEREDGFIQTLKAEFPDVKIIQDKYAGATLDDAIKSANELLASNPDFQGVFASNESSALGMLAALREKGLAGKVKFVGFDSAKGLLDGVEKGEIVSIAVQNPRLIGSIGVAQALNAMEQKKIEQLTVIPARMIDQASLKLEAEIRKQQEEEEKRAVEIARIKEESDRLNAEKLKAFEAEQAKTKDELRRQEEADKKREDENKRLLAEFEKQNAEKLKAFEAEQFKYKEEMRLQQIEETKREAEIKRLKDENDSQNAAKLKEIEDAQKKYKDDLAKKQADDQQRDLQLKKMKEDFDLQSDEQRKKIEAEQKAHEGAPKK